MPRCGYTSDRRDEFDQHFPNPAVGSIILCVNTCNEGCPMGFRYFVGYLCTSHDFVRLFLGSHDHSTVLPEDAVPIRAHGAQKICFNRALLHLYRRYRCQLGTAVSAAVHSSGAYYTCNKVPSHGQNHISCQDCSGKSAALVQDTAKRKRLSVRCLPECCVVRCDLRLM